MSNQRISLSDDLRNAHEQSRFHVWNGIGAAIISLFVPIFGPLAAYSGYNLVQLMERQWFGVLLGVFGVVNFALWIVAVLFLL
ncbi:hypothetical protein [Natronococcus occultus]|uniref:Uncharacterized protein n=1 Tax=Natronococcus occultus SP4 TaxID=694430 RepID=L0JTL7_9EURY|nr:hypothetical protein [Natronococcus occultus]AGB36312.1 hypothetical protein Natoc_0449 [Natronococcus occultus SP4]